MTMVGSTARPGVRRGDVSEEPRRWMLIAVLVAALVPTTHAVCSAPTDDPRCSCHKVLHTSDEKDVYITCNLDGDYSQVPSFRPSNTIYWNTLINGKSSSLTIQAGAFKNLKTKQMLILSRTKVTIEAGAFSGVGGELEQLIIKGTLNMISDGAFDGLGQLKNLHLDRNRLKSVNRLTFSHLPKLTKLRLTRNQIEAIHDGAFDGLSRVKVLELVENRLKTVSHRMFRKLSHLETLSLAQNQLETIPDDTFFGLGQLKYLELSNNRLTSLNATVVSSMSQLNGIMLRDNPLTCDCRLAWIQAKVKTIDVEGLCANPPSARSKSVTAYDVSQCKQDTTNTGIVLLFVFKPNFKP